MGSYRIISSDDHVTETPDLWTSRVEPQFRERAPGVVRREDGDWWFCDGLRVMFAQGSQAGVRFDDPQALKVTDVVENARPGGYIPEEHVKDMDLDGLDVSIIYPTVGLTLYGVPDSELFSEVCRVYNDWAGEHCLSFRDRLKGIGMVNLDDVEAGITEMRRCRSLGLVGAMVTVYPPQTRPFGSQEYEPFWAAAQELGMPLSLHLGTNRALPGQPARDFMLDPVGFANRDLSVRTSLAQLILSGVFERYPKLMVGGIETELSWIPHFLNRMDYVYTQKPVEYAPQRFGEDMLPSDYFHRNVFISFQEDAVGVRLRDIIGVDNLQWGSDYPHVESTFPRSREILDEILADCTEEEKEKIVGANAARVYGLE